MFVITCSDNPIEDTNNAPTKPEINLPPNSSTNQSITPTLSWTCTDSDNDKLKYDVYFGLSNNPSKVVEGKSLPSYAPGTLQYNTKYYWKITAKDSKGATSTSDVWTFTTESQETISQPSMPSGVDSGNINESLSYSTGGSSSSIGHSIQYQFNWGDGSSSNWSNSSTASHQWSNSGNYNISSRARCATHTSILSNWSSSKPVVISKEKFPVLAVSPNNLDFDSTKTNLTFNITNSGDTVLNWNITDTQNWITVNPISGTTTTESDQITVTVNRSGLTANTYNGNISITSNGGSKLIPVSMTVSQAIQCSITVTSPLNISVWNYGGEYWIGWDKTGSCGENVKITLLKGIGELYTITSSTPNDGFYSWKISDYSGIGSDYQIKVEDLSSGAFDNSSNFSITTSCDVSISNPTSSSAWINGDSYTIKWKNTGLCGTNVKIELYKGGSKVGTIFSSTINDGSRSWTVTDYNQGVGTDYRIKITDLDAMKYSFSNYFEIKKKLFIVTLNPVADAAVASEYPNSNFGDHYNLVVGNDVGSGGKASSYIRFNLSTIPSNARIEWATLKLYPWDAKGSFLTNLGSVYDSWSEMQVTWNTGVRIYSSGILQFTFRATDENKWKNISVRNLVKLWLDGNRPNYGFAIWCDPVPASGNIVNITSRTASNPPVLQIGYYLL